MNWIDVKDELPSDFQVVVVYMSVKKRYAISSIQHSNITTADQKIIEITQWADLVNCQVTHWAFLGKP